MDDRQRLEAIVSVINKYLPPDGIPINDAMSEIISLVDPLPAPQPAQKPYAFDWLPEGATHLGRLTVNEQYGGVLEMRTHAFKYEGGVLMVYRTDNDNEYPEWIDATKVFVHTNFQVFPIAPPQPAQEPVTTVTSETRNPNVTMSWWHEPALPVGTKLYADPPQREWVGLTDEEIDYQAKKDDHGAYFALGALWAEAKLKEKNT